jgi:hypothetical protein
VAEVRRHLLDRLRHVLSNELQQFKGMRFDEESARLITYHIQCVLNTLHHNDELPTGFNIAEVRITTSPDGRLNIELPDYDRDDYFDPWLYGQLDPHILALAKEVLTGNSEARAVLEDWCLERGISCYSVMRAVSLSYLIA